MRTWLFMLGGLLVWSVHFLGIYGIASVADVVARADAPLALLAVAGLTLACALGDGALILAARRRSLSAKDGLERFTSSVAGLAAAISLAAVLWQGLPALIGH